MTGASLTFSHLLVTSLTQRDRRLSAHHAAVLPPHHRWCRGLTERGFPSPMTLWLLAGPRQAVHSACLTPCGTPLAFSHGCEACVDDCPWPPSLCSGGVPALQCPHCHSQVLLPKLLLLPRLPPRGPGGALERRRGTPGTVSYLGSQVKTNSAETSDARPVAFPGFY